MGQEEVLDMIIKRPRRCIRELSKMLNKPNFYVSRIVTQLVRVGEVRKIVANEFEVDRIMTQWDSMRHAGIKKIYVYEAA